MKIVIVGGGTAGWMAALTFARAQPGKHKVVLVESDSIPIVGAGEGSTRLLHDFLYNVWFDTGIDQKQFFEHANATHKSGIKHVNWTGDGSSYFAPLDGSSTNGLVPDVEFCLQLMHDPDHLHRASQLGRNWEKGIWGSGSYHFDAFKVGDYFSKIAIESGVEKIVNTVWGVNVDQETNTIKRLVCENGEEIEGDFFVDCTGFKRTLCGAMDMKWKSYKENLPVDSAIAFRMPIEPNYERLTTATAMNNGWCWKIPTAERYGCGYVYSSDFCTKEQAHEEIRQLYGDVKIQREFQFNSGRSEELWKGNCLALGLAAAFSEPLEATSIHCTIMQTVVFALEYLKDDSKDTILPQRIEKYNSHMAKLYDDMRDFLVVHYMGGRTDTEFWRHITAGNTLTPGAEYVLDVAKNQVPSALTIDHYFGCAGSALYNWVLAGIGKIDSDTARKTLERYGLQDLDHGNFTKNHI